MTENDAAWQAFLDKTSTLQEVDDRGFCYVTASSLKRITGREPRLLAKLDRSSDRPRTFAANNLTIFPVKNGEYILFRDPQRRTYYPIDAANYEQTPISYTSGVDLNAYDAFPGIQRLNESQALDFAYLSSLLREFTGDTDLHLVIRGRSYTGSFSFTLPESDHLVTVNGVQIEIDGGYESRDAIYLIEAKTGRRDDFHIRQLYYPYLEWTTRSRKRVVPIFLAFTNGKFHLLEFGFGREFGELSVERAASYVVNESPITRIQLSTMLDHVSSEPEPSIPFPQADDLDKIADLVAFVDTSAADKAAIAEHFEFDERQGDYYANAAIYLGLAERTSEGFAPTVVGRRFIGTRSLARRSEWLVEQMMRRPVFREAMRLTGERGCDPNRISSQEIAGIIERYTSLSGTTPRRRASTVQQWLRWVTRQCQIEP